MDVTTTPEPVKKRGRPRKVVVEDALVAEPKGVRKASTKTAAAGKSTPKASKTTSVKGSTAKSATKAKKAVEKVATVAAPAAPKVVVVEDKKASPTPTPTPVTPSTSKILEQVRATGSLKKTGVEAPSQKADKISATAADAVQSSQPDPLPSTARPILPTSVPTSTSNTTAPASPSKPTSIPMPTPTPSTPKPPTTSTATPRSTTIPLPRTPVNPFPTPTPAPPRPKPLSSEALEKQKNEAYIRSGKMPPKYRPAARRVITIMVGIPVILVMGWDLWKRYDKTIRTKFDTEPVKKPSL